MGARSNPRAHTSAGTVERTSVFVGTHHPSRGGAGSRGLSGGLTPRSRGVNHPVQAKRARGSASRSTARTTKGVRGTGSRRGLARRNVGANLHLSRSGPHRVCFFGGKRCAARQPVPSLSASNGADEGEGGERVVTPSSQNEETVLFASVPVHRRIAEVGRTPSGSEKRATSDGRVESLVAKTERVNGSLTVGGRSGAQAQGRTGGKRGADHRELGDPHHVSAASSMKAAWFRPSFGAGEMRVGVCRWKAPWIGKAHAFHEAPAEPVLAASEPASGARRKASPRDRNGGGDRGVRGDR